MKALDRKQLKQVIVLGVLFLVVIAYTVFQLFFTGSTGASTKGTAATTSATGPAEGEQQQQTTSPSWLMPNEPARDPFVIPPQFDNLRQNRAAVRPTPPRVASAPNIGALPPMPVVPVPGSAGSSIVPPPNDSAAPSPEPSIAVTGVVIGDYPVAILRGESGSQRIAQPGHQLEGGYVLRAVSREGIVLEKDGKTVTLRPGGNPNAK